MNPINVNVAKDNFFETRVNIISDNFKIENVRAYNPISAFFLRIIGKVVDIEGLDADGEVQTYHINKNSFLNKTSREDSLKNASGNELVDRAVALVKGKQLPEKFISHSEIKEFINKSDVASALSILDNRLKTNSLSQGDNTKLLFMRRALGEWGYADDSKKEEVLKKIIYSGAYNFLKSESENIKAFSYLNSLTRFNVGAVIKFAQREKAPPSVMVLLNELRDLRNKGEVDIDGFIFRALSNEDMKRFILVRESKAGELFISEEKTEYNQADVDFLKSYKRDLIYRAMVQLAESDHLNNTNKNQAKHDALQKLHDLGENPAEFSSELLSELEKTGALEYLKIQDQKRRGYDALNKLTPEEALDLFEKAKDQLGKNKPYANIDPINFGLQKNREIALKERIASFANEKQKPNQYLSQVHGAIWGIIDDENGLNFLKKNGLI